MLRAWQPLSRPSLNRWQATSAQFLATSGLNMNIRLERAVCSAAIFGLFVCFVWLNFPVVLGGLGHADDAYFAMGAKTLAAGRGYGIPWSDGQVLLFNIVSAGPALILPVALAIMAVGPVDWLPALVTTMIFGCQLLVAAGVLWRGFGYTQAAAFVFVMMTLLMIASASNWYFGAFLGEPIAFGFLLIAMAIIAVSRARVMIATAALCLSLAVLTKLIALFAAVGIVGAWAIVSAYERKPMSQIIWDLGLLVAVGSILPLIYELVQLATLGWSGYIANWKGTMPSVAVMAIGSGDISDRLATFVKTFDARYASPLLVVCLVAASTLAFLFLGDARRVEHVRAVRFALLALGGVTVYFAYILLVSTWEVPWWPRYYWIGVAVGCCGIAAPALVLGARARMLAVVGMILLIAIFGWYKPLYQLRQWESASTAPQERASIVQLLDSNSSLPVAADSWNALYDIIFLEKKEGPWAWGPDVKRLRGQPFVGIIGVFTNKSSAFFKAVTDSCELLTPGAQLLSAYRCNSAFWNGYGD
jgi:hypothetical protein